jgi:hypothetical protein
VEKRSVKPVAVPPHIREPLYAQMVKVIFIVSVSREIPWVKFIINL